MSQCKGLTELCDWSSLHDRTWSVPCTPHPSASRPLLSLKSNVEKASPWRLAPWRCCALVRELLLRPRVLPAWPACGPSPLASSLPSCAYCLCLGTALQHRLLHQLLSCSDLHQDKPKHQERGCQKFSLIPGNMRAKRHCMACCKRSCCIGEAQEGTHLGFVLPWHCCHPPNQHLGVLPLAGSAPLQVEEPVPHPAPVSFDLVIIGAAFHAVSLAYAKIASIEAGE